MEFELIHRLTGGIPEKTIEHIDNLNSVIKSNPEHKLVNAFTYVIDVIAMTDGGELYCIAVSDTASERYVVGCYLASYKDENNNVKPCWAWGHYYRDLTPALNEFENNTTGLILYDTGLIESDIENGMLTDAFNPFYKDDDGEIQVSEFRDVTDDYEDWLWEQYEKRLEEDE